MFGHVHYYDDDRGIVWIDRPINGDIYIPCSMFFSTSSGKKFLPYIIIPKRGFLAKHLPVWIWPFGRVKLLTVKEHFDADSERT